MKALSPIPGFALALALVVAGLAGCANKEDTGLAIEDLGAGQQEFETSARGGTYRFQYVSDGPDGYRTVFWRQGDLLSDDNKDAELAESVVRTVFHSRFCREMKKPVSFADGSPAPTGKIGIWTASLRCAEPPPKPKKPKEAPKKKPSSSDDTVAKAKPAPSESTKTAASESKPSSTTTGSTPAKPAAPSSYDGPMVCKRVGDDFECKPKS